MNGMLLGFISSPENRLFSPGDSTIFTKLGTQMLTGMLIPQEFGGSGLDMVSYSIVIETLAKSCASTAIALEVH